MKKLLIGCMAAIAALIALSGCDQDKVLYNGSSYLMFSDTLYTYAVQETNEIFNVPVSATKSVDYDRTLAVEVIDKESNAVEGKHYRILSNTATIKAPRSRNGLTRSLKWAQLFSLPLCLPLATGASRVQCLNLYCCLGC